MASATFSCDSLPPRMQSFQESLTAWATLLGVIITFIGLIQSRTWLAGIGTLCVVLAIAVALYARRELAILRSAEIDIEGRSIDSLNLANIRRRTNRSLVVQEAHHTAIIEGADLRVIWRYSGYCRADRETAMEFSIDSDNLVPFELLDCFGYDLLRDPSRRHKIKPLLIGPDGNSKKLAMPFLRPIDEREAFSVELRCGLPGSMPASTEYYTSTLSFSQEWLALSTTRLLFLGDASPDWVRVYECTTAGTSTLVRELAPAEQTDRFTEYLDQCENISAQCARIYVFRRSRP